MQAVYKLMGLINYYYFDSNNNNTFSDLKKESSLFLFHNLLKITEKLIWYNSQDHSKIKKCTETRCVYFYSYLRRKINLFVGLKIMICIPFFHGFLFETEHKFILQGPRLPLIYNNHPFLGEAVCS